MTGRYFTEKKKSVSAIFFFFFFFFYFERQGQLNDTNSTRQETSIIKSRPKNFSNENPLHNPGPALLPGRAPAPGGHEGQPGVRHRPQDLPDQAPESGPAQGAAPLRVGVPDPQHRLRVAQEPRALRFLHEAPEAHQQQEAGVHQTGLCNKTRIKKNLILQWWSKIFVTKSSCEKKSYNKIRILENITKNFETKSVYSIQLGSKKEPTV